MIISHMTYSSNLNNIAKLAFAETVYRLKWSVHRRGWSWEGNIPYNSNILYKGLKENTTCNLI